MTHPTSWMCRWRPGLVVLLCLLAVSSSASAEAEPLEKRRVKALQLEKRGAWLEACRLYEDLLRKQRNDLAAREGYQRCLRRLHLMLRHADPGYRQALGKLALPDALDLYEQILTILQVGYPDRWRTSFTQLFQQGVQEVGFALDDPRFRDLYLAGVKPAAIQAYKGRLASWPSKKISTRDEARDQVLAVLRAAAREGIPLRPLFMSALALEFAAGACNALDEHSHFLSPGNLSLVQSALRGKVVGVGMEVGIDEGDSLRITRVHDKGPAYDAGLKPGDRLLRLAGEPVEHLPAEFVSDKLLGDAGTGIEIEVATLLEHGEEKRTVKLIRRYVDVSSVEYEVVHLDDGTPMGMPTGYLKIHSFEESTLQELKEALASMSSSSEPIKGLILDLRGNPGGVFKSAVSIAELFVTTGVIVTGQSSFKEYNKPFKAEAGGPIQLPLVVLIDSETASAAEVLAGALQAGRPSTKLLGQTTFGKGSIQCIIPVEKGSLERFLGIRLTVAKLFSPTNQPITGRGVTPDILSEHKEEFLVLEARKVLLELIRTSMPPRMMVMNPS